MRSKLFHSGEYRRIESEIKILLNSQPEFLSVRTIEFLSWKCLTIGALGWGQIQIANSDRIDVAPDYSRKKWMLELCDTLFEFYPHEINKIGERIDYFKKIREQ